MISRVGGRRRRREWQFDFVILSECGCVVFLCVFFVVVFVPLISSGAGQLSAPNSLFGVAPCFQNVGRLSRSM
jgi:hypothetical protein